MRPYLLLCLTALLSLFALQGSTQGPGLDLHQRTERALAELPQLELRSREQPFWQTDPGEAQLLLATLSRPAQPAEQSRILELASQLENQYGEDLNGKMKDPRWQEMVLLSQSSALERYSQKESQAFEALDKYRRETHAWLKKKGRLKAKAWGGRVLLAYQGKLADRGEVVRFSSEVAFVTQQAYFQSSVGRAAWSGGYDVTFAAESLTTSGWSHPERTISRPGKAFSTLYLGRDGWFLKFHPVASGHFRVPLPSLSNLLLNAHHLPEQPFPHPGATFTSNGEPGQQLVNAQGQPSQMFLQGIPYQEGSLRQRGRYRYERSDGGKLEIGFDFSPVP